MEQPRRALISVADKKGIVAFCRELVALGWEVISTGGTARELQAQDVPHRLLSDLTGAPEMLGGRVKTLHPRVHGGILYLRDDEGQAREAREHEVIPIDMVAVNFYPFRATAAQPDATDPEVIEQIDIGGPALVRSAAKNHADVLVVVRPERYSEVLTRLRIQQDDLAFRRELAAEAYAQTAAYDAAIASWMTRRASSFPAVFRGDYVKVSDLRYGENPHQRGAFYRRADASGPGLGTARVLPGGKELSYNNLMDADAALACVRDLPQPACVVVKHGNPCGAGTAPDLAEAFRRALAGDPQSAYGGIVALGQDLDESVAACIMQKGTFFEVIVAPAISPDAANVIRGTRKWGRSVRLLEVGSLDAAMPLEPVVRTVSGGLLVQSQDVLTLLSEPSRVVTRREPTDAETSALDLAWRVAKHVRSNAIVLAREGAVVGVGAGQMSRVDSVKIAVEKAGERAAGAALASDAFFPFPDGVETAARAGVTAVIQPGGSIRDADVIQAADAAGVAMLFTGIRHFRH